MTLRTIFCLSVFFSVLSTCAIGTNPILNGGFEDGTDSWSLEPASSHAWVEIASHPFAPDGNKVLVFDHERTRSSKVVHRGFPLKPYSFYILSFWSKSDANYLRTGHGFGVNLSIKGGGTGTKLFQEASFSPEEWQLTKVPFVTAESPNASLVVSMRSAVGKVWIDHLRVTETSRVEARRIFGSQSTVQRIPLRPGEAESDVFYNEIPVSLTIPSRIVFRVRENLPKGTWRATGRFIIELPEGVALQPHNGISEKLADGAIRHTFEFKQNDTEPRYYGVHVFALTDRPDVDGLYATCWIEWNGGKQSPYQVPIRHIDIPPVAQPNQIFTGTTAAGLPQEIYPDYFNMLQSMGFNAIDYWKRGKGAESIDEFMAHGMDVDAEYSGFGELKRLFKDVEGLQSIDLKGRPRGVVDASHRGEGYDQFLADLEDMVAKGFSCIMIDDEHYGADKSMDTCLCDRCKARWKEWLPIHRPDLEPASPEKFLDDPLGHQDHYDAWWYFRANLVTEWYQAARKRIHASIDKYGARSGAQPWFASYTGPVGYSNIKDNFMNAAETAGVFDKIMPMYYSGGYSLRREIRKLVRAAGREYTYGSLNMGTARSDRRVWQPGEVRAQMLEVLFSGAKGYMFWSWNKSNLRIIAEIAETNGVVADNEEIFLNGDFTERFWIEQPRTYSTTLETDDAGMFLVTNYTETDNSRIQVFKRPEKAMTLTEVYTGEKINLAANRQIFTLYVPSAQCGLWKWEK